MFVNFGRNIYEMSSQKQHPDVRSGAIKPKHRVNTNHRDDACCIAYSCNKLCTQS